jgi:hypothetical protein
MISKQALFSIISKKIFVIIISKEITFLIKIKHQRRKYLVKKIFTKIFYILFSKQSPREVHKGF